MTDTPPDGELTPPGPPPPPGEPALRPPDPPTNPYGSPLRAPTPPPSSSGDAGLGWTAFGLAVPICVPILPVVALVLAVVTLARRRFQPRWIAVVALVAGLLGTGIQAWLVTSDDFWDGVRDGMNQSVEDDTEDARRSGEPRQVSTLKLRRGDCINDPALKDAGVEPIEAGLVTLLPCEDKHDLEVFATIEVPGKDFPGQDAIDRLLAGCFDRFATFVGKPYADSKLEMYHYFPTKQSWDLVGDDTISCVVGHPKRQVTGTLRNANR